MKGQAKASFLLPTAAVVISIRFVKKLLLPACELYTGCFKVRGCYFMSG